MVRGLVVADTDILIDYLRDRGPGAEWVDEQLRKRRLCLTAISAFELRLGADWPSLRPRIERLIARRTLPLDASGAVGAGALMVELRRKGTPIDLRDALIAGVCLRFELPLTTRNLRHFARVQGLRLERIEMA